TRTTQIAGSVIGGTISLVPDGGPITRNVPSSGAISVSGEIDDWTFFGRAGDGVSIFANPGDVGPPPPVSPTLGFAKVELVAPNNSVVASGSSTASGQNVSLLGVQLQANGTYHV